MENVNHYTVRNAFYDLLRAHGINTIFGNPGSTEQTMLKNFPSDFQYVLSLQEASVVATADGYAQATRKPAVVSLHTAAGTGNGMGNIMTAFLNKTPLVIIAGQQTREMLIGDPFLTNRNSTIMPQPWIKWAYEPVRAVDVPAAVNRALAMAMMPPAGPVYLSVPWDDWNVETTAPPLPRTISTRIAPDPKLLQNFANRLGMAKRPVLILGSEVDRSLGWNAAVQLAELLQSPVFQSPMSDRASFPERHRLFRGPLPGARGPLSEFLAPFDLVLVVGAEIFRYYPWVPGPIVPDGIDVLHITNDPHDAASALVGDSLLSDSKLALEALFKALKGQEIKSTPGPELPSTHPERTKSRQENGQSNSGPITPAEAFEAIAEIRPSNAILLQESPSNGGDLMAAWPTETPESYMTFASGGLGWGAPASVGVAYAQKQHGTGRPVILVVGDGSIQYSIQSIYTAVQHKLKLIYIVPQNFEYAVLKEFGVLEETPGVPGLDLHHLDAVAIAKAYGCRAVQVNDLEAIKAAFREALMEDGPTLIQFQIDRTLRPLVARHHGRA